MRRRPIRDALPLPPPPPRDTVRIVLHGRLRKRFGKEFRLGVTTPAAATYALCKMVPDFAEELAIGQYRVRRGKFRGGVDLPAHALTLRLSPRGEMHIIPAAAGSKNSGGGKIIVGAILVVAAIVLMQPEVMGALGLTAGTGTMGVLGTSLGLGFTTGGLLLAGSALILTGVLSLLSPQLRPNGTITSFLMSGLGNTSQQGLPVPLVYGIARIGSVTISTNYSATDFYPPEYIDPNNPYQGYPPPGENFPVPPVGGTNMAGGPTQMAGSTGLIAPVTSATAGTSSTNLADTLLGWSNGGFGSSGGKGSAGSSGGFVQPDTLHSNATVSIIDVLSEGPIGGLVNGAKSIFFNGTPLQADDGSYNFRGVSWEVRYGYPDQEPVPGYPASSTTISVNRQVKQANPIVQTITGTSINSASVTMMMPALMSIDHYNGDVNTIGNLSYIIDVRPSGPGWVGSYENVAQVSLNSAKASSAYELTSNFALPLENNADTWDIRVTRLTGDSTDIVNIQDDTWWEYLVIIDNYSLMYPNTAYIAYSFDASLFGSSLPTRQVEIYGVCCDVPANYDPALGSYSPTGPGTSNGTWDMVTTIQRPTSNPAWQMLDILTNSRYGCGISSQYLQTTAADLYQIAQYCDGWVPDGFGGTEQRYTVNCVIANQDDAYRVLQMFAAAFRGTTYWGAGQVVAVADMPRAATKLINQTNVIDGNFSYQGTSLKTRHNIINVSYLDSNNQFLPGVEPVLDTLDIAKRGAFPTDLIGFGCITRSLAHRLGKWALYTENNQTETVTWKGGAYHLDARPGDVVKISDPAYIGARMAGRLQSITVPAQGCQNLLPDSSSPVFSTGATNTVVPSAAVAEAFAGTAVYAHTRGAGSDPDVGYLSAAGLAPGTYYASCYVWIPAGYAGAPPTVAAWGSNGINGIAIPFALQNYDSSITANPDTSALVLQTDQPSSTTANLTLTGQWQRLTIQQTLAATDTLTVVLEVPAAGQTIYSTAWMVDPGGVNPYVATSAGSVSIQTLFLDAILAPNDGSTTQQVSVVMPDGTIDDLVPITSIGTSADGTYSMIYLARPLVQVPSPNAEWILTDNVVAPRQFSIVGIAEDNKLQFSMTALNYEPGKFEWIEDGIAFDQQTYSLLPGLLVLPLPAPTNVVASDNITGIGVTQTLRVVVGWTPPVDPRISGFQVLAQSGTVYDTYSTAWAVTYTIDNLAIGTSFSFGVRSVGPNGQTSAWAMTEAPITLDGSVVPPDAPTGLAAVGGTRQIQIAWVAIPNRRDIIQYEIWGGSTPAGPGDGATLLSVSGGLSYTDHSAYLLPNTTWYYFVRAIALGNPNMPGAFAGPAAGTTSLLLTDDLADAILNTAKFAQSITPVQVINTLTDINDLDGNPVPLGAMVVDTVTGKLYRRVATGTGTFGAGLDYVAVVAAVDISGQLTADQIASIDATQVSGQLTAAQITSLDAAQLTGQITRTQITPGAVSTPQLDAGSVTTATLAAGAVTTSNLAVSSPSNVCWNSCMEQSNAGWNEGAGVAITGWGAVAGTAFDPTWKLIGYGTGYIQASVNLATNGSQVLKLAWDPNYTDTGAPLGNAFPPSTPIEAQALLMLHRCCGYVAIAFYNAAGTLISQINGNRVAMPTPANGTVTTSYVQSWVQGVSPATCARARLLLIAFNDGGSDIPAQTTPPFMFFTEAAIGLSVANATQPQPWVPGGVTSISGTMIKTRTIAAAQIVASSITTNEIAANTITAADIAAGTITATQIAANTITASNILGNTITAAQIAAGAIGATQIAAGSINANLLASDFALINSAQIGSLTVGTSNIQTGAVTAVYSVGNWTWYNANPGYDLGPGYTYIDPFVNYMSVSFTMSSPDATTVVFLFPQVESSGTLWSLERDGVTLASAYDDLPAMVLDVPPMGAGGTLPPWSHTYKLFFLPNGGTGDVSALAYVTLGLLSAMVAKR